MRGFCMILSKNPHMRIQFILSNTRVDTLLNINFIWPYFLYRNWQETQCVSPYAQNTILPLFYYFVTSFQT